jgi:hypothetical protein
MALRTHSGPPLPSCATRQDLLDREQWLRSDAKLEPETRRAALLANAALNVQKTRHQHEGHCPTCRLQEVG